MAPPAGVSSLESLEEVAGEKGQAVTPTEAEPLFGEVQAFGVGLSLAERWVEDGVHIFRSLEFDVVAGDEDFDLAVDHFVRKLENLWTYLSEAEELSENENETFLRLAPRFHNVFKELERRDAEQRRSRLYAARRLLRTRGEHPRTWLPSSTPRPSSVGSSA
jgi:hypothetical protein